jgi:hypothetical protein
VGERREKMPSHPSPFYDKSKRQKKKRRTLRITWESFKTWEKIFLKFRNASGTWRMVDVCVTLFIL